MAHKMSNSALLVVCLYVSWVIVASGFVSPMNSMTLRGRSALVMSATVSRPVPERTPLKRDHIPSRINNINGSDEFIEAMASNADRPVVIKFYDKFCRACKAVSPKFERMSQENPGVSFYQVSFSDNKSLCRSLGIKMLPTVQIYRGAKGKVADLPVGPKRFHIAEETLSKILNDSKNNGDTGFIKIPN